MSDTATPSELLTELQRLHQAQYTGALFVTGDRRVAQINLERGEIVYLSCQNKGGQEALPLLREMGGGKLRLTTGPIPTFRTPLPPTRQVLDYLGGRQTVASTTTGATAALSATQRTVLQEELTEFIGPMALLLCEEQLRGVTDVEVALATLSGLLASPDQVARFQTRVRKRL